MQASPRFTNNTVRAKVVTQVAPKFAGTKPKKSPVGQSKGGVKGAMAGNGAFRGSISKPSMAC